MSQSLPSEELSDSSNNEGRNLPSPEPPPNISIPVVRPLHPPPALALNIPRPPGAPQYSIPTSTDVFNAPQARMPVTQMISLIKPQPPMLISSTQPQPIPQWIHQFLSVFLVYEYHLHQDPNSQLCLQRGPLYLCTCLHLLCHPWSPSHLSLTSTTSTGIPIHTFACSSALCTYARASTCYATHGAPATFGIPPPPPKEAPPLLSEEPEPKRRGLMTLHLFRRINFWLSIRHELYQ